MRHYCLVNLNARFVFVINIFFILMSSFFTNLISKIVRNVYYYLQSGPKPVVLIHYLGPRNANSIRICHLEVGHCKNGQQILPYCQIGMASRKEQVGKNFGNVRPGQFTALISLLTAAWTPVVTAVQIVAKHFASKLLSIIIKAAN